MSSLSISDYLKYANLQMAAEALYGYNATIPDANLIPSTTYNDGPIDFEDNLTTGNLHASIFTPTQVELSGLTSDWVVVEHLSNTSTGFSGTLFKHKDTGEQVMSFRSTEFIDDAARDNQATNTLEIKECGWAFGQIDDMQNWYASLQQRGLIDGSLAVTGYSLGGHLATAFNLLYPNVAKEVVTFNGAGVGTILDDLDYGSSLTSVMNYFHDLRKSSAKVEETITEPELLSLYRDLRAELSELLKASFGYSGEQAKNIFDSFKGSAEDRLMAARPSDPFKVESLMSQRDYILEALSRVGKIFIEAHRVPDLSSGGTSPSSPADIPDSSIAQVSLDYQMAVLLAAERTDVTGYVGNGWQMFTNRDFADVRLPNQYDLMGAGSPSMVANSNIHYGEDIKIFIENQPLYRGVLDEERDASLAYSDIKLLADGYEKNDFGDTHSLVLIIDSLNVQNTLLQLVPEAQRAQATTALYAMLQSASWRQIDTDWTSIGSENDQGLAEGDVLENVVNALAQFCLGTGANSYRLNGNPNGGTWAKVWAEVDSNNPYTGREALYAALKAINKSDVSAYDSLLGKVNLVSPTTDGSVARGNLGQFLALYYLSPFALEVDDEGALSALMAAQGDLGSQWDADQKLSPEKLAGGEANFSDTWLQDRAAFLAGKLQLGNDNQNPVDPDAVLPAIDDPYLSTFDNGLSGAVFYEDVASGYQIALGFNPADVPDNVSQYRFGAEDADTFTGGEVSDHLYGMGGNDTLKGEDGIDHLEGGSGDDNLQGGSGDDTLLGMSDNDTLDGGTGDDILNGGKGDDRYEFHSSDGNDQVIDSDGQGSLWLDGVQLKGGKEVLADAGSWRSEDSKVTYVVVSNPDQTQTLNIQYGDSLIRVNNYELGQLGITLEDADDAPPPVNPDLTLIGDMKPVDTDPTTEEEDPEYDSLDNVITTDEVKVRQDVLHGDVGNDSIQGLGDDDQLYGKGGNDTLEGGVAQDLLVGGGDNDLLIGGEGSDIVRGDEGDDSLYATAQVDIASVREQTEGSGLKGDWLTGGLGDDVVVGDSGKDVLFGGGGKDTVFGGAGDDVINGDDNFISTSFNWVVESYGSTFDQYWSSAQIEQFSLDVGGNDFLYGGAGNDWVSGLIGNDYLYGDAGEDTLKGGAGHDLLFGGDDNDLLTGDYSKYAYVDGGELVVQGNDTMDGGAGDDSIQGEAGEDLLIGAAGNDTLWGDASYLNGGDHGNDRLEGGIDNDNMFGDGGNDVLFGGEGNDLVVGDQIEPELAGQYHGQDTLYGEAGMDTLFGGGGSDELYGGSEDDQLSGDFNVSQLAAAHHGNDVLYGEGGNDKLWGNGGNDTLYGGADNDQLQGDGAGVLDADSGDDVLLGDIGQDTLAGGGGNDTLNGGAGFDYLVGGAGDDTYIFNVGDGPHSPEGYTEFIQDAEGSNIIEFGAGITADDVDIFLYPDGKVLLQYGGSDEIFMEGGLSGSVKTVKFSDGSSYSLQGLFARNAQQAMDVSVTESGVNLTGSAGSNQLIGTGGSSTFQAGRGDDILIGDGGGNLYIYERGDGIDHIYDTGGHSLSDGTPVPNRVQFGAGIRPQDVSLAPGSDGNLEVLIAGDPSGKLIIHNFDTSDAANSSAIDYFDFADGTSTSYAALLGSGFQVVGGAENDNLQGSNLTDVLLGNAGNDTLSAGGGDDTLQGGMGDDLLVGGDGADLYLYAKGQGSDILVETDDAGLNILRFAAGLGSGDIELAADPAQNLLLKIISSGETLVLANWLAADTDLIQRIEFADGTVWTPEWIRENLKAQSGTAGNDVLSALPDQSSSLYGLAGNDTLNGSSGNDQLVGGIGNDSLVAGLGDDSYLIELGDGQDTLVETGGQDAVLYGAGIVASDVSVHRVGSDLLLSHTNGSDRLTIKGWFAYTDGRAWVEEIRFADGNVWSADELTRQALTQMGSDGNDNLKGSDNFGDTLSGGAGNDTLYGYSGDDHLAGGAGYDYLYGGNGNDTLAVGAGGGYADGGLGDDLYLYDGGDGALGVGDSGGDDSVRFGEGIQAEDAKFQKQGNSLTITLADGGQIILNDWFYYANGSRMIERFQFADGATLTATELNQILLTQEGTIGNDSLSGTGLGDTLIGAAGDDHLYGYSGNDLLQGDQGHDRVYGGDGDDRLEGSEGDDRLYGEAGNDSLDGGAGDDYLIGGSGDDSYLALGQGQDRIFDAVGLDSLYFINETRPEQLIITRVNADLHIGFVGRDDSVILLEWFRTPHNIERFIFADGSQWGAADIGSAFNMISGNGSLNGSADDDLLYGNAGQDMLLGGTGNDLLDGSAGADTLVGGAGDDTYIADGGDTIVELPGEGIDTLVWTGSSAVVLQGELENLVLAETAGYQATGNTQNNYLMGNNAGNSLNGGAGADTLEGGLGNDNYNVDDPGDRVIELVNQGADTVISSVTFALGENVENLSLSGAAAIDGVGNLLGNKLLGNDGSNRLEGFGGNDYIQGGLGVDTLLGGEGDDVYRLDDYGDVLIEQVDAGHDLIVINPETPMARNVVASYRAQVVMADNIEDLRFTGYVTSAALHGNSMDNVIDARGAREYIDTRSYFHAITDIYAGTGNDTLYASDAGSILNGGAGDDVMTGGAGGDTYYVDSELDRIVENTGTAAWYPDKVMSTVSYGLGANLENLTLLGVSSINGTGNELGNTLTGNSGNNLLDGGAGNDWLSGGGGSDTLVGGIGNDTYVVNSLDTLIIEQADEGVDSVEAGSSYTLDAHVENLTLTGSAVINGTGNELDNLMSGNSVNNRLLGGAGSDTLNGFGGNDYMQGSTGDDILDGGLGNDTLLGGAGDDVYYVGSTKDVVAEYANEGIDRVYSNIAYTLGGNLESLILTGSSAIKGTGNALDNRLTGNAGANSLSGGSGNDTLDGGAGSDTLIGGLGSDTYLLGLGHGADTISESGSIAGNNDIARFMSGIEADQLWLRQVGTGKNVGLEVSVIGTDDKFIIDKWYAGSQYHVEQFETADGQILLESQVQNLVDAMASFSPPAAGQTTLPENYQTALSSVIAANWQ